MNVGLYLRISRDDEDSGLGVARQEKDARSLAKQCGWKVTEVYSDNDASAFNGTRREWARLLEDVRSGKVQAVIAWANDRLYRKVRDQLELLEAVEASGGIIATVKDGEIDPSSASGRAVAGILANIAAMESGRKAERLRAKHAELAERGLWPGGRRAFGYRVVKVEGGKSLEVVPEEAEAIREAARMILGGAPLAHVVKSWNDAGRRTTWDRPWEAKPLKELLCSPGVAGLREHRGKVVGKAAWKGILLRRQWEQVRAEFDRRTEKNGRPMGRKYLLTGLLVCQECGEYLLGHGGGNPAKRSYYCLNNKPHKRGRPRIRADKVEAFVWAQAGHRTAKAAEVVNPEDLPEAERLNELESRLAEMDEMYADGTMDRESYARAARKVREQRDKVEAKVAKAAERSIRVGRYQVPAFTDKRGNKRADMAGAVEVESKREHLAGVVARIVVRSANRNSHLPVSERVEVTWRT
jgi:site-specific DNA recombinase